MTRIILTISGEQYDVTEFSTIHPGGREILLFNHHQDATESFHFFNHSSNAKQILRTLNIKYKKKSVLSSISSSFFSSSINSLQILLGYLKSSYSLSSYWLVWYLGSQNIWWILVYLLLHLSLYFLSSPSQNHLLLLNLRSCTCVLLNWLYHSQWIPLPLLTLSKSMLIYSILLVIPEPVIEAQLNSTESILLKYIYEFYQCQSMIGCLSDNVMTPFIAMMPTQVLLLLFHQTRRVWYVLFFVSYSYLVILGGLFVVYSWNESLPSLLLSFFILGTSILMRKYPSSKYVFWTVYLSNYIFQ